MRASVSRHPTRLLPSFGVSSSVVCQRTMIYKEQHGNNQRGNVRVNTAGTNKDLITVLQFVRSLKVPSPQVKYLDKSLKNTPVSSSTNSLHLKYPLRLSSRSAGANLFDLLRAMPVCRSCKS
jgi:hypothetical protein